MVKITSQIKKKNDNAYVMGRFTGRRKTNNVMVKTTSQLKKKTDNAYVVGRFTDRRKTYINVMVKTTCQIKKKQTMHMSRAYSPMK